MIICWGCDCGVASILVGLSTSALAAVTVTTDPATGPGVNSLRLALPAVGDPNRSAADRTVGDCNGSETQPTASQTFDILYRSETQPTTSQTFDILYGSETQPTATQTFDILYGQILFPCDHLIWVNNIFQLSVQNKSFVQFILPK